MHIFVFVSITTTNSKNKKQTKKNMMSSEHRYQRNGNYHHGHNGRGRGGGRGQRYHPYNQHRSEESRRDNEHSSTATGGAWSERQKMDNAVQKFHSIMNRQLSNLDRLERSTISDLDHCISVLVDFASTNKDAIEHNKSLSNMVDDLLSWLTSLRNAHAQAYRRNDDRYHSNQYTRPSSRPQNRDDYNNKDDDDHKEEGLSVLAKGYCSPPYSPDPDVTAEIESNDRRRNEAPVEE